MFMNFQNKIFASIKGRILLGDENIQNLDFIFNNAEDKNSIKKKKQLLKPSCNCIFCINKNV